MCENHTAETKATHTPGPWSVEPHDRDENTYYIIAPEIGNAMLAKTMTSRDLRVPADIVHANARLIAAAPELLAVAKKAANMLLRNTLQDSEDTAVYQSLRSAIAKAEGGK